jgi:hypothetical protein
MGTLGLAIAKAISMDSLKISGYMRLSVLKISLLEDHSTNLKLLPLGVRKQKKDIKF